MRYVVHSEMIARQLVIRLFHDFIFYLISFVFRNSSMCCVSPAMGAASAANIKCMVECRCRNFIPILIAYIIGFAPTK